MGKRDHLKAVRMWGGGGGGAEEEEKNDSLQTEPTWEHKSLSGTDSILYARCKSILLETPEKGAYKPEERL